MTVTRRIKVTIKWAKKGDMPNELVGLNSVGPKYFDKILRHPKYLRGLRYILDILNLYDHYNEIIGSSRTRI